LATVADTARLGLRRATDDQQLLSAVQENGTLVTLNLKGVVLLHDAWPGTTSG
jgi:hypothetical protein